MKINRYMPFACIYFFFNSVALPFGLTYTVMLAPFFYVWILLKEKKDVALPFIAVFSPFVAAHVIIGVDVTTYAVSFTNFLFVYIFCRAVYTFLKVSNEPEKVFRGILIINFILCLVAIPFYFTPYFDWFWMEQNISAGIAGIRRLKMFTYEPSYYAMIFTPVFFFFLLQYFFRKNHIPSTLLSGMLFLPYMLSFSIGVIAAILISMCLTWLFWLKKLTKKRRILNTIVSAGVGVFSLTVILAVFFRNNLFFSRLANILAGQDTSGKGRTIDAFILARKILHATSEYWGAGLGQIKIAGENIISNYYMYYRDFTPVIPNAAAETLAIFGWVGFSLRIIVLVFFFFYTRVWSNYFRLLLFFFMFIYQFTGSFITNVAEYVIWVLAFTNVFSQFDVKPGKKTTATPL